MDHTTRTLYAGSVIECLELVHRPNSAPAQSWNSDINAWGIAETWGLELARCGSG
ncbi:MAG: hypothetical protein NTW75_13055 [Planctomycetales bacterium]|nr:hypothetical protein [Planctomycetales bacterium]